jgi:hypothetical protein
MSFAIAPPSVTNLVPGVTGRNHPFGTNTFRIVARLTPLSARKMPVLGSKAIKFESADVSMIALLSLTQLSP